ncbi:hypothetical protein AAFN85_11910 [Mucilaginibacter sp. CAU 1740]|uniref:hypothetical protein n=1 Tax=Mucilaginibacter sp. CAU 1740 TaxID=3140365 RepID=UPI00325AC99F
MSELKITGGGYIGNANATWPLATLKVTADILSINLGFAGQVFFNAEDITSIQPSSGLSRGGIRIIHTVNAYPQKVVFTTSTSYQSIIEDIKATGFFSKEVVHDQTTWHRVKKLQQQGRFPFKTAAIIVFLLGWNVPILLGVFNSNIEGFLTNAPISLSFAIAFILLTLFVEPFRILVLKEDRDIKDLRKTLYFILLIVSVIFVFSFGFRNLPPVHH